MELQQELMKKKTILYIADNSLVHYLLKSRKVGGGTISTYELLDFLKSFFQITILVSTTDLNPGLHYSCGFQIFNFKLFRLNRLNVIDEFLVRLQYCLSIPKCLSTVGKSDFILSQVGENFGAGVYAGKYYGIPSLVWIRETTNLYKLKYFPGGKKKNYINYFLKTVIFRKVDEKMIQMAGGILTNSLFMKGIIWDEYAVEAKVVYPTITFQSNKRDISDKKAIGFINPIEKKGLATFLKLVEKMPDVQFVTYGNDKPFLLRKSRNYTNWAVNGWIYDRNKIFQEICILVVPSIKPEAFGRVAIEAINYNVLPIVSDCGGLPEAVQDDRLVVNDKAGVGEWEYIIRYYLNNPEERYLKIEELKAKVTKFSVEIQGGKFIQILETVSDAQPIKRI